MSADRVRVISAPDAVEAAAAIAAGQHVPVGRPTLVRLVDMGDGTFAEAVTPARPPIQRIAIPLATNSGGACTAYSPTAIAGLVIGYYLDIGAGGTALAATTDVTVSEEDTASTILTLTNVAASARVRPRVATHDDTGTVTGALDAPAVVGRLKVVVAQGGDTRSGTLYVYIDGSVAAA